MLIIRVICLQVNILLLPSTRQGQSGILKELCKVNRGHIEKITYICVRIDAHTCIPV